MQTLCLYGVAYREKCGYATTPSCQMQTVCGDAYLTGRGVGERLFVPLQEHRRGVYMAYLTGTYLTWETLARQASVVKSAPEAATRIQKVPPSQRHKPL